MKHSFSVIGLMSGTSLDGVDICAVDFELKANKWSFKIKCADTFSYTNQWIEKLQTATKLNSEELLLLDVELGQLYGKIIRDFIHKHQLKIDFIGSHGHTVFHQPKKGFTLQIGNGQYMANLSQLPVYTNFRSKDVSLGGQGAPLVPIGDLLLFQQYDVCFNFGGICNVSFTQNNKRVAYDVCPFNIPLNLLANQIGRDYDEDGRLAQSGNLDVGLLQQLDALDYYKQPFPKSLGIEWFNDNFYPLLYHNNSSVKDKMHTVSVHIAKQIALIIDNIEGNEVLFSGGGTYHSFIVDLIKSHTSKNITIPTAQIINYKEALIFAFLAVLKHQNQINVLKSVTGASSDSSSGVLFEAL